MKETKRILLSCFLFFFFFFQFSMHMGEARMGERVKFNGKTQKTESSEKGTRFRFSKLFVYYQFPPVTKIISIKCLLRNA